MYKSSPPQDALIVNDTASATGTGFVTWAKTGLQYVDLAGVGHFSLQTTGTYNVTQLFQMSNDLTTWYSCLMQNAASVPIAEQSSIAGSANNMMEKPVQAFQYFRINVSVYNSGTYNVRILGKAGSAPMSTQPTQTALDGTGNVVVLSSLYPSGATAVSSSSGNVANSAAVATLAGAASKTTYITGFTITGAGATAASVVSATITGLLGGTATYTVAVPAGVNTAIQEVSHSFSVPFPASATNTAIVVTLPALGAGNTNATVCAFGYQL